MSRKAPRNPARRKARALANAAAAALGFKVDRYWSRGGRCWRYYLSEYHIPNGHRIYNGGGVERCMPGSCGDSRYDWEAVLEVIKEVENDLALACWGVAAPRPWATGGVVNERGLLEQYGGTVYRAWLQGGCNDDLGRWAVCDHLEEQCVGCEDHDKLIALAGKLRTATRVTLAQLRGL